MPTPKGICNSLETTVQKGIAETIGKFIIQLADGRRQLPLLNCRKDLCTAESLRGYNHRHWAYAGEKCNVPL